MERIYDLNYSARYGLVGQNTYNLMKTSLKKRIQDACRKGCTDEELATAIKDNLEHYFGIANRVDKYSHIVGGWIVMCAAMVGLSDVSYVLVQHAPGQFDATISTMVSMTAAMILAPVLASPAAKTFRGLYRVLNFGKSFVRDDTVSMKLDELSTVVRQKQTSLESQQVGRNMEAVSFAASRAKEAADLIASVNQVTGPGRAVSNLATIAVLMHKYFPELSPQETNDVNMAVHELFTKWLPEEWKTADQRAKLFGMIISVVETHDDSIHAERDVYYYRVLVGKWLDLN
jgi:hypothetical protein